MYLFQLIKIWFFFKNYGEKHKIARNNDKKYKTVKKGDEKRNVAKKIMMKNVM
jgi:hypothetical protein